MMRVHPRSHAGERGRARAELIESRARDSILAAQVFEPGALDADGITAGRQFVIEAPLAATYLRIDLVNGFAQTRFDVLRHFIAQVGERLWRQIVLIGFETDSRGSQQ